MPVGSAEPDTRYLISTGGEDRTQREIRVSLCVIVVDRYDGRIEACMGRLGRAIG
jgi:hypothetical protein